MNKKKFKKESLNFNVSILSVKDLDACFELDKVALQGFWSRSQWEEELNNNQKICLGIYKSSGLIALVASFLIIDELNVTALGVHPEYRQQGYGKLLLNNLFDEAIKRGGETASLEVSSINHRAIALYRKLGFKSSGLRLQYYKDGSDAIIKTRALRLS